MGFLNISLPLKDEVDGYRVFKHRICYNDDQSFINERLLYLIVSLLTSNSTNSTLESEFSSSKSPKS